MTTVSPHYKDSLHKDSLLKYFFRKGCAMV